MPETRYHELLGLPPEVSQPDYFQLLLLTPDSAASDAIEARFKEQMTKLQMTQSNKHKEFIEYLKGELKNARRVLTDAPKRREYVQNLRQERIAELKKYLGLLLVDKSLSTAAEKLLLTQAQGSGLGRDEAVRAIEEELKKAGARRIQSKAASAGASEQALMRKIERYAEAWRQAKLEARLAEEKVLEAEQMQKEVEELERTASAREQRAAALETSLVRRHQDLMGRLREANQNLAAKARELLAKEQNLIVAHQDLEELDVELTRKEQRALMAAATLQFYLTLGVLYAAFQLAPYFMPRSWSDSVRALFDRIWRFQSTWGSTELIVACVLSLFMFVMAIVAFFRRYPIVGNVLLLFGLLVFSMLAVHLFQGKVVLQ